MHEFNIRVGERAETFRIERDYAPGDTRQHWTLAGLEKLIRLQLWKRELDRGGNVKVKPPQRGSHDAAGELTGLGFSSALVRHSRCGPHQSQSRVASSG